VTTCTACGGDYVEGVRCPARGDECHRRGRGRPRAGASDLRATELRVRLSPAEWADVSELSRLTGQTASVAVRTAVTRALRTARARSARMSSGPKDDGRDHGGQAREARQSAANRVESWHDQQDGGPDRV
jgi:hypothetical protein